MEGILYEAHSIALFNNGLYPIQNIKIVKSIMKNTLLLQLLKKLIFNKIIDA